MGATTARGLMMLRPSPLLMPRLDTIEDTTEVTAMVGTVVAMAATVDTTARGLLMLRPSPAMDTMAMDMVMDTSMVDTDTDVAMDTTARGLLMLSPAMDTTAMDMVAMDTAAATDTAMAMATTDKKLFVMQFGVQYKN